MFYNPWILDWPFLLLAAKGPCLAAGCFASEHGTSKKLYLRINITGKFEKRSSGLKVGRASKFLRPLPLLLYLARFP
jgi:hypothetical protein